MARAVAPEVSYQIGQYFKGNDYLNGLDNGSRNGEGSAPHILAHGILAAAVSYATGSDPTTGALSAMGAEAAAKPLAQYLFGTSDTSKLTAEQKATVSSITSLAGLGIGASTGNVGSAVNAGETARTAVEDNTQFYKDYSSKITQKVENFANKFGNPGVRGSIKALGDAGNGAFWVVDTAANTLATGIHCLAGGSYCKDGQKDNRPLSKP